MKNIVFYICVGILLVMHAVGFYGLVWGDIISYLMLTSLNLCITFSVFIIGGWRFDKEYLFAVVVLAIAGFFIEVIGVKTEALFGKYSYGKILGAKAMDVPLVIGLNWSMLLLSCADIARNVYNNILVKAAVGATLMLFFDIMLEPIALKYDYWYWDLKIVPLQNYVAWWFVSFMLLLGIFKFLRNPQNAMGYWVYGVQLAFFSLLNLAVKFGL